jgi:hypothetical protein
MALDLPVPTQLFQAHRTEDKVWVWDGIAWYIDSTASALARALSPAAAARLVYAVSDSTTALPTAVPDLFGTSYVLSAVAPFEPVQVYLNGVLLVLDPDGSGAIGDYVVHRDTSTIELLVPPAHDGIVQIDILLPSQRAVLGAVNVYTLLDFDSDWAEDVDAPPAGLQDGSNAAFPIYYQEAGGQARPASVTRSAQVEIYLDGVRQQPDVDYTASGAVLTMASPPAADAAFWGVWYQPADAGTHQHFAAETTAEPAGDLLDFGVVTTSAAQLNEGGTLHVECRFLDPVENGTRGLLTVEIVEFADAAGAPGAEVDSYARRLVLAPPSWPTGPIADWTVAAALRLPARGALRHYQVSVQLEQGQSQGDGPAAAVCTCWLVGA